MTTSMIATLNWEDEKVVAQIKETYGKKLNLEEWKIFLAIGQFTGLNPFLKELYAIKYGNAPATFIIARDGYRKSAQRHSEYDWHIKASVYTNDEFYYDSAKGEVVHKTNLKEPGNIKGAYCLVKRKNSSRPNYTFVKFDEYYAGNRETYPDGKIKKKKDYNGSMVDMGPTTWDSKPATMIEKVAESQGLRMTFQELFAGTYDESELDSIREAESIGANKYDPATAPRLKERFQACKTMLDLKQAQAEFIQAHSKGAINEEETEALKTEFNSMKKALEVGKVFDAAPEVVKPPEVGVDMAKPGAETTVETTVDMETGEVIESKEKGYEPYKVGASEGMKTSHGIDDPCDDKACLIHGTK